MEKLEKSDTPILQKQKNARTSHPAKIAAQTKMARDIQSSPLLLAQRKLKESANGSARATAQRQFGASIQKVSAKNEHRRRAVQSAELAEEEEGTVQAKKTAAGFDAEPHMDAAST